MLTSNSGLLVKRWTISTSSFSIAIESAVLLKMIKFEISLKIFYFLNWIKIIVGMW